MNELLKEFWNKIKINKEDPWWTIPAIVLVGLIWALWDSKK